MSALHLWRGALRAPVRLTAPALARVRRRVSACMHACVQGGSHSLSRRRSAGVGGLAAGTARDAGQSGSTLRQKSFQAASEGEKTGRGKGGKRGTKRGRRGERGGKGKGKNENERRQGRKVRQSEKQACMQ